MLTLTGQIVVGGQGCGCDAGNTTLRGLSFACPYSTFAAVASTDCPVGIATPGAVGDSFVELPVSDSIGEFLLLSVKSSAPVVLRIGAGAAELAGASGTFPTGFVGGETFSVAVDGVSVPVVFTSAAQSALQVALQVNQAALAAGLAYLPMSVSSNGQLKLAGSKTGVQGSLDILTANAAIGFASAAAESVGAGEDLRVNGLALLQFDASDAPERIQISGSAQVEVLAAGSAPS